MEERELNMHEDEKPMAGVQTNEVVCLKKTGGKAPLFFTYPVSGSVFCYTDLAGLLTMDRPVFGIQSIGLDGGRLPPERLETMAWHVMESITGIQPVGPYHLAGWSFAGLVALETAARMNYSGLEVALLCMMDTQAPPPAGAPSGREAADARAALLLAADLDGASGAEVDLSMEEAQWKELFQQAVLIKKRT
ncbi:MAG: hypothetical protein GY859_37750, partial [Desulfobacterales bacterium]|nr:hypothetical protein [Desulfobacterales bacterium]